MALEKVSPEIFRQRQTVEMIAKEVRERIMYAVCVKMSCSPFDIVSALAATDEERNTVQVVLIAEHEAMKAAVMEQL